MSLEGLSREDLAALKESIARWALDPVSFVVEVFGPGWEAAHPGQEFTLDPFQVEALQALVGPVSSIALQACKGPGKSTVLSFAGLWFLTVKQHPRIAAASITGDNLWSNLWPEFAMWMAYSPLMTALFEHKGESIVSRDHPKTWWIQARTFKVDADLTKQAEALAGLHSDDVLILLDEVGSMPLGVMAASKAIFNVQGQRGLRVVAGNCTEVGGALHRISSGEDGVWKVIEITGDPDRADRCSRINIDVARAEIAEHGRDDPTVMVNILGKFPPRGDKKLLGSDDVSTAVRRNPNPSLYTREARIWGLDVAGEAINPDFAVLTKRQGCTTLGPCTKWRNLKADDLADRVAMEYANAVDHDRKHPGNPAQKPDKIFVDKGNTGRAVVERLQSLLGRVVEGVDFGGSAIDDTRYLNRRAEMWWLMAQWVKDVGAIPDSPDLRRDLCGPSVKASSRGGVTRNQLESKEDMAKRGLPSPDEGDSLALTFAAPVFTTAMAEVQSQHRATADTEFNPWDAMRGAR